MEIREDCLGNAIVCAHMFPPEDIIVGSKWISSGNLTVIVESVIEDRVTYSWIEHNKTVTHSKDSFCFQCRYCLVL
jgi:predicted aldo/keto reductase-like oxidoreductase